MQRFITNDYLHKIALVSPKEAADEIKNNPNIKKASGSGLVTGEILKMFHRKAVVKLIALINAFIGLNYVSDAWKMADEVIIIPKLDKNPSEVKSYRLTSLQILSKLFEKLSLNLFSIKET